MRKNSANDSIAPKRELDWDKIDLLMKKHGFSKTTLAQKIQVSTETLRRARTNCEFEDTLVGSLAGALEVKPIELYQPAYQNYLNAITKSQDPPDANSSPAPSGKVEKKIALSRILRHSPKILFGRDAELDSLDAAWANPNLNVYTLVAWGGAGKTSLVAHWVQERLAAKGWPGVERYFDWSFYSQGTGESRQTSSDLFIQKALEFFGDPDPIKGSPWERGERLAELTRKHRTLLILDGIEPLQYPPTDKAGMAGRLKDQALEALLQSLAQDNPGLCVVTTREHLTNIEAAAETEEKKLDKLLKDAAVALLRHLQVVGTDEEMHKAWEDAGGHALTLHLLGRFIADAYEDKHIRHFKEVKFENTEEERMGRSAFKVMIAYEKWLAAGNPERQRELAILRLSGLFDRPMTKDCLTALRSEPVIAGLTDALVKLKDTEWNIALKRLSEIDLITVAADSVDAHPLIREYFAKQLKDELPEAFKAAHSRLFDHLCEATPHRPDSLEGLGPLYQAVFHGCLAGRQQEACDKVYYSRILRGDITYSMRILGAIGANLSAVAAFFETTWSTVSINIDEASQAWVLNDAALLLQGSGRIKESLEASKAALAIRVIQQNWYSSSIVANNLSESAVFAGMLENALEFAYESILHADKNPDRTWSVLCRANYANIKHQTGRLLESQLLFEAARRMQAKHFVMHKELYSTAGFLFCEFLLSKPEQHVWRSLINREYLKPELRDVLTRIFDRATDMLEISLRNKWALQIGLGLFSQARASVYREILFRTTHITKIEVLIVDEAIKTLRKAGQLQYLSPALLTAALYHFVRGEHDLAKKYLNETQQIAERGPMPLYLADVHLHRARMFKDKGELAKAKELIVKHGYGRRNEELGDAEEAAKGW